MHMVRLGYRGGLTSQMICEMVLVATFGKLGVGVETRIEGAIV